MERSQKSPAEKELNSYKMRRYAYMGAYGLVLAIGAGNLAQDTYDILREDQSTTVEALPSFEDERNFPNTAWIMVPGYNMAWRDSREAAEALKPELEKTGQVHWIGYSNEGFDIDEIKTKTLEHLRKNDLENVSLYGYSFGGMVSVELATYLAEHDVNVKEIVLDSSPHSLEDVRKEQVAVRFMAVGAVGSFARAAAGVATEEGVLQDYLRSNDTEHASARLLQDSSKYIVNFDLSEFASKLPEQTRLTYIGSDNDDRIETSTAYDGWKDEFSGRAFLYRDSTPAGHASPRGDTEIYIDALRPITNRLVYDLCRSDEPGNTRYIEELCTVEVTPDPALDRAV